MSDDGRLDRIERKINRIGNLMVLMTALLAAFITYLAVNWFWPTLQAPALVASALAAIFVFTLRQPFRP
jgi:prepilin signal peptidase PulO-like enzyme (type II secretory pathway)